MQIDIKGRNVPVTEELRDHAERRLAKVARQVSDLARLEIELFKEPNPRVADCHVAEGTLYLKGVTLRAHDASPDVHHSLNLMVDELARQVKRHRDKLRHRREATRSPPARPTRKPRGRRSRPSELPAPRADARGARAPGAGAPVPVLRRPGGGGSYSWDMASLLDRALNVGEAKKFKTYQRRVALIGAFEGELEHDTDAELRERMDELRERAADGESLDELLPECFAIVRETGKRTMGMRHFDVQLIGGMALHDGQIAEMKTGEGKTLTATAGGRAELARGHDAKPDAPDEPAPAGVSTS